MTVRRGREEEDRELESGNTLGPYHLDALIGEGGMGLVFRATHEWSGKVVAVKVLKRELTQDGTFKKRFKQEVRASGEIRNRHLVPIVEAGESDGRQYLVVGYVAGGTLEEMQQTIPDQLAPRYEPRHYPYFNLARVYVRQHKVHEAIRELQQDIAIEPRYTVARRELHRLLGLLN